MSGVVIWRRGTRALALCALSAALSGCYYYVPPSTQLACVPVTAPSGAAAPAQQPAPNSCPAGTAANYVQTPGYTTPYYGYPYGSPYYGYPYYGYYGYYGWPGYGYGPGVSVGFGWGWGGWGWRGGHRWR